MDPGQPNPGGPRILRRTALAGLAASVGLGAAPRIAPRLDAIVDDHVARSQFSGVVLVQRHGRRLWERAHGAAERAFGAPIRPDTRFRIMSITKLFTAVLVSQLSDEGRLDLDAPIATYLPAYGRGDAGKIPLTAFLRHASGLPNTDTVTSYEQARAEGLPIYQHPFSPDELVRRFASGPPVRPFGTVFDYNNGDYFVLGKAIEAVAGSSYETALQKRILDPLGLKNTSLGRHDRIVPRLAQSYFRPDGRSDWVADLPFYIENFYAAGAMVSTAADLATFADGLYGGRLLRPASLERLLAPGLDDYACGQWIRSLKVGARRYRVAERYGRMMGANTLMFRVLDADLTVIVLANTNVVDVGELAAELSKTVLAPEAADR